MAGSVAVELPVMAGSVAVKLPVDVNDGVVAKGFSEVAWRNRELNLKCKLKC